MACANVICAQHGCQGYCRASQRPPDYQGIWVAPAPIQRGCICPPTSEQTCQNPLCPRKPVPSALHAGHVSESPK
jgi:hypothetical protein